MNSDLKIQFEVIRKERTTVLQEVSSLTEEQFNFSPHLGKWSISQILTHVLTSEQLSLGYMTKKAKVIHTLDDSGWIESLKMLLLKVSQRIPLKYKAPKVVVASTPAALSKEELSQRWHHQLNELKDFLETIEDKHVRKKIYKHPIAGRLDVRQALQFFQEHFHHHLPQVWRLLE